MYRGLDNFTIERNETQITTSIVPLPIFTIYECTAVATILVHASLYVLLDQKFKSSILGSFLMVTASLYGILITKSKDDTGNVIFDIQSAVFYSDCIKCIAMLTLIHCKEGCSMLIVREVRRLSCSQLLLTCLPAVLFAIQNNLVYYTLQMIDPSTFQLLNCVKVPLTAIVSYFLMKQSLDARQWFSVFFLCLGLSVAFICEKQATMIIGSLLVLLSQTLGAVGLVLNEFVLKKISADVSFETKNLLLYTAGIAIDATLWNPSTFFVFGHKAWVVTFYASLLGISIAYLIKQTDSITRNLVGTGSLIMTNFISSLEHMKLPQNSLLLSTIIVVLSMLHYYNIRCPCGHRYDALPLAPSA